ncbi:DUF2042 domain containing protein, partial [Euroglyphus maynei]
MIPSVLTTIDIDLLIKKTLENKHYANSIEILCDTYVTSKSFLEQTKEYFEQIKKDKAEEDLRNGLLQNYFFRSKNSSNIKAIDVEDGKKSTKDDHGGRKGKGKGGGGSGGGGATQKREVKTKAVKKKYKPGQKGPKSEQQEQDEPGLNELEFISLEQVINVLTEKLTDDVSNEFIESIAESIIDDLRKSYEIYAKELFITRNAEMNKTKKSFAELQSFVNSSYSKILLFNKAIEFIGESSQCFKDLQSKLVKHLLRTLATDIVNELVTFFNDDEILSENISFEARTKIINKLDVEFKNEFLRLNESLNSNEVQTFIDELDECAVKIDLMIKKIDSKKEKLILSEHQQSLLLQLNECQDSILGLHILVLLVFQMVNHHMLHASGKFVPQILQFLQKNTNDEMFSAMKQCQDYVMQFIAAKD